MSVKQRRGSAEEWFESHEVWLTVLILILAFWLRWPFPEPQWTHVDERAFILYPLGFWSGDFNPHFFNYPTFPLYVVSAIYYLYFLLFSSEPFDYFVAYRYFVEAGDLLFIARGLSSLLAVGTVAVAARLGRRLYGSSGGILAGLILAVMPLSVRFSHLAIIDVPATLLGCLAVLWAVRIHQQGRWMDYLLAGLFVGVAGSSKYPAALAGIPVLVACLLRTSTLKNIRLWSVGAAALLSFAATSPYVWLDSAGFWADFSAMGKEHLLSASHGTGGASWFYLLRYNLRYGLGLAGLATLLAALVWNPKGWRRDEGILLAGIAAFGLLLLAAESVFMRYSLPLAPLLAVLAVRPLLKMSRKPVIQAAWLALLLAEPIYASLHIRSLLSGPDTRTRAYKWMQENVPDGCRLVPLPDGRAGHVKVLSPMSLQARKGYFIDSFGVERCTRAFQLLSESEELPPLYVLWNYKDIKQRERFRTAGISDSVLVVWYQHPLCVAGGEDSLAISELSGQIHWQHEFLAGDVEDAEYDRVDWYFMPIGGWGAIEETGPTIRLGKLPVDIGREIPTAQEFFDLLNRLMMANRAMEKGNSGQAIDGYKKQ